MSQPAKPSSTATAPTTANDAPKRATENKSPKQREDAVQRTNRDMARPGDAQAPADALPHEGQIVQIHAPPYPRP
ncbi:MAG: hypothetical protein ABI551_00905 [Polyangiaceae bacterium]